MSWTKTTPVEVTTRTRVTIDVTDGEAFYILCKAVDMPFILEEDFKYYPKRFDDENCVVCYLDEEGNERVIDDRGPLFIALCNVCVNMFPNVEFRGESFIYK